MYISSNKDQLTIEDFFMPFGGKLLKTNRWVRLASMMPWEHIEQVYMESVDLEQGRPATPSRVAFGAIFIKENDNLTDEGTVAPADIKYPTAIDLLNKSREHLETAVDILWNEVPHKG